MTRKREAKSVTESVNDAPMMPPKGLENAIAAPEEETLKLTVAEGRLLRRIALQIKSRCDNIWANRATIGRLPMLKELTAIKEGSELFYAVLTDATWRECINNLSEERKV